MSLGDLNKELHNSDIKNISVRSHEQSQYDPSINSIQASPFDEKLEWEKAKGEMNRSQKNTLRIAAGILAVVVLSVGSLIFYSWWKKNAFHQDRVSISFEGPKEADSTQLIKYVIHYKNDNRVTLKNAEIQLNYSENFQPTDNVNMKYLNSTTSKIFIGDIPSKSEGSVELKGIFYAPKDFPVYLHGSIRFKPSNADSELAMETQMGVNITTAPVILDVTVPELAVDGDKVEYVIDYKNLDIRRLSNVQIRAEFPKGFQLVNAQPMPSQNGSYWTIGNLDSNDGGKIRIKGSLHGDDNESKAMIVTLGRLGEDGQLAVYNKRETSTRIVLPILTVVQKVDGSNNNVVNAGDVLRYGVKYLNTGVTGLRNAIVTVELQGKILDFTKISAENGFFDGSKNTITWKASDVPALANINPNEGGELYFSVPVKSVIPIVNKNDKNFIITSVAKIDSPDIPTPIDSNKIIGSNELELKLASKVLVDTRGYYTDSKIKNTGPIPMESGKETLFAIHWSVVNISNDLVDAKLVASLPSGVKWTGMIYPFNEKISYDNRTNQIIWNIGSVEAGIGSLLPAREVEFQVGITPQINQIGQQLKLVNKSIFTAKDTFVGSDITIDNPEKNTQLIEDTTVGYEGGKVAK